MVSNGSTGRIMLNIAKCARDSGAEVRTYSTRSAGKKYVRDFPQYEGHTYYGSHFENTVDLALSRVGGGYGAYSRSSTARLIRELKRFSPDIIHLHNLHTAFVNLKMLFDYCKKNNISVIWTLHDCWSFTGQCPYFTMERCDKWKTGCYDCPQTNIYPKSRMDNTKKWYAKKKKWFCGVEDMTLVTPSEWLAELTRQSFLKDYPVKVINNGIDLSIFKPTESDFRRRYNCEDKFILLGVAFGWGKRKGLDVFVELSKRLDSNRFQIVLVGTSEAIDTQLPSNIISIHKTDNQSQLAEIYTAADLFVNPTREENFPTVNIESIACGTPVITFNTGGSPEIIDDTCGCVVDCDDIDGMERAILRIESERPYSETSCMIRAQKYDMNEKFKEYVKLYENSSRSTECSI